jgi:nitrous oxide reductase
MGKLYQQPNGLTDTRRVGVAAAREINRIPVFCRSIEESIF